MNEPEYSFTSAEQGTISSINMKYENGKYELKDGNSIPVALEGQYYWNITYSKQRNEYFYLL